MRKQYAEPEVEICQKLHEVLEGMGFDVYHSVRFAGLPGCELDVCGVRLDEFGRERTIAIQAKMGVSLSAYNQAIRWREYSTYTVVASFSWPGDKVSSACTAYHDFMGIGLWLVRDGVTELFAPKAQSFDVRPLATAARASSSGIVVKGGSRSPRRARKPDLLAEELLTAWNGSTQAMLSVRETLTDATDKELLDAVKVLRKHRGAPTVRDFGRDWLLVR